MDRMVAAELRFLYKHNEDIRGLRIAEINTMIKVIERNGWTVSK
jgi:hypothetical protein